MTYQLWIPAACLLLSLGCHPNRPVLDPGPLADVGGSVSGMVTASGSGTALAARKVTAINVASGQRFEVSTSTIGGYTVRVPAGKYRLEVELREGETLAGQPQATDVGAGDLDAGRDFVIAAR